MNVTSELSLFIELLGFADHVCVGQIEDPACLYEVGKTVLHYEDEQILYRPLGESESSQTSGGDSGNFSHDETDRTSDRSDDSERNRQEVPVCVCA